MGGVGTVAALPSLGGLQFGYDSGVISGAQTFLASAGEPARGGFGFMVIAAGTGLTVPKRPVRDARHSTPFSARR